MSTRWSPDALGTVTAKGSMTYHLVFVYFSSIKSWLFPEVKSTFCGTYVLPRTNVFGHFLILLFSFNRPFILTRTVHFYDSAFDLPSRFFCLCNMCLFLKFQTSSDVARHNIFYNIAVSLQSPFATIQLIRTNFSISIVLTEAS